MPIKIKNLKNSFRHLIDQLRDLRMVGLMLFLVIVILVSWSGVKAIQTNYGLQKQISAIKQENDVKKLANDNLRLKNQYYDTPQYLEIAARQNFGLAAQGETVLNVPRSVALKFTVDLPEPDTNNLPKEPEQPFYQRNFQAWVDFFLNRKND